jgi:hypothetical protein
MKKPGAGGDMLTLRRGFLIAVMAVLLAGCGQPKPTPAPTAGPQAQPTWAPTDTLPPDGWFSIRAAGRVAPPASDYVIVYENGLVVYTEPTKQQKFQKQMDAQEIATWRRMFITQANFMSLKDNYPATTPAPDDNVRYTILLRQGDTVKTVTAQKSGAPPMLQTILDEFWNLVDEVKSSQ